MNYESLCNNNHYILFHFRRKTVRLWLPRMQSSIYSVWTAQNASATSHRRTSFLVLLQRVPDEIHTCKPPLPRSSFRSVEEMRWWIYSLTAAWGAEHRNLEMASEIPWRSSTAITTNYRNTIAIEQVEKDSEAKFVVFEVKRWKQEEISALLNHYDIWRREIVEWELPNTDENIFKKGLNAWSWYERRYSIDGIADLNTAHKSPKHLRPKWFRVDDGFANHDEHENQILSTQNYSVERANGDGRRCFRWRTNVTRHKTGNSNATESSIA